MSHAPHAAAWRCAGRARRARPYRRAGRFAWHFARGKLRWDPVFRHLLARGLIAPRARVLDIGCGQGLLASLLEAARRTQARRGRWPRRLGAAADRRARHRHRAAARATSRAPATRSATAPTSSAATCARAAFRRGRHGRHPRRAALRRASPSRTRVLARVRAALADRRHGCCCASAMPPSRRGFATSQWVDRLVVPACAARARPQTGRPLATWMARLVDLGFRCRAADVPRARRSRTCFWSPPSSPPRSDAMSPATLDHAGIEALMPHRGTMCLLDRMTSWDADADRMRRHQPPRPAPSAAQRAAACWPARRSSTRRRRWPCTAALLAPRRGRDAVAGLPGQRARRPPRRCWRLDDLPAADRDALRRRRRAPGGRRRRLLYAFRVAHDGRELASGRVAVVLDAGTGAGRPSDERRP